MNGEIMGCDMCGKEGPLFQTRIEGTIMNVCNSCKGHGEVIARVKTKEELVEMQKRREQQKQSDYKLDIIDPSTINKRKKISVSKLIREDYSQIIKKAREQRGMKQEDLAKKLHMKESLLHNFESGHKKPNFEDAAKLEKYLGISLTEEFEEKEINFQRPDSGPLTLGDMIKIKKR